MGNCQKYKAGSPCKNVLDENIRDIEHPYSKDCIDPNLTHLNYRLDSCSDPHQAVKDAIARHEQVTGKKIRKDANVMFSWVVTVPKDVRPEDQRDFFETTVKFLNQRYGFENCICASVHLDEPGARPHLHYDSIPVLPNGKLNCSKFIHRTDLITFHKDLNKAVDEALGYHVSVELDESKKVEKALSKVPHELLGEVTAELDKRIGELNKEIDDLSDQKERLRREVEVDTAISIPSTSRECRAFIEAGEAVGDGDKGLRERAGDLRLKVETTKDKIRTQQARIDAQEKELVLLDGASGGVHGQIKSMQARFRDLRGRVVAKLEQIDMRAPTRALQVVVERLARTCRIVTPAAHSRQVCFELAAAGRSMEKKKVLIAQYDLAKNIPSVKEDSPDLRCTSSESSTRGKNEEPDLFMQMRRGEIPRNPQNLKRAAEQRAAREAQSNSTTNQSIKPKPKTHSR